jgi:hypothetical protein
MVRFVTSKLCSRTSETQHHRCENAREELFARVVLTVKAVEGATQRLHDAAGLEHDRRMVDRANMAVALEVQSRAPRGAAVDRI